MPEEKELRRFSAKGGYTKKKKAAQAYRVSACFASNETPDSLLPVLQNSNIAPSE